MSDYVVAHRPEWAEQFEAESAKIRSALEASFVKAHHIGSTAVPGILAKPIIDLLIEVKSLASLDGESGHLVALGYQALGEYGITGRRYFRKQDADGVRTHHLHAYEAGDPEVARHLAFRDYLLTHPERAQEYSALKRRLVERFPDNVDGYVEGKQTFVRTLEGRAQAWGQRRGKRSAEEGQMTREIRAATVEDLDAVSQLYLSAFGAEEAASVAKLARELIQLESTPATLSLVACDDTGIVAHVGFSPVHGADDESTVGFILAPLAVAPASQGLGVGTRLVERGLKEISAGGKRLVFVYGDPAYYSRFGFAVDEPAQFLPPFLLSLPLGWQVINPAGTAGLSITCVPPLMHAELW